MFKTLKIFALAAAAALLVAAPASAATKSSAKFATCKDAGLVPKKPTQVKRLQRATRCLVNQERRKKGLRPLKLNKPLQSASDWQAQDMLTHAYFDHTRPGGPEFVDRILRFGYADGATKGYLIGENLAWASAPIASPRQIVRLWMHSPPHRKNILTRDFRDQAITALWSPTTVGGDYADSGGPFLIYVNQFGRRY